MKAARWLPALACAAAIFWFSAQPDLRIVPTDWLDFILRKAAHMTAFGALAAAVWFGFGFARRSAPVLLASWAVATLYAFTDEFHQSFVPGRHAALTDVAIDASGAAFGLAIALVAERILRRRRAPV